MTRENATAEKIVMAATHACKIRDTKTTNGNIMYTYRY